MNYKKHYDKLIITRKPLHKVRKEQKIKNLCYFEQHHIIPKCLGGSNEKENFILLTAREHYIAHWLLSKIYPDTNLVYAQWRLSHDTQNGHLKINSRKYELLKEKHKKHMSSFMQGEKHPMYGIKRSDHTKKLISQAKQGNKHTVEAKNKIGQHGYNTGKPPWENSSCVSLGFCYNWSQLDKIYNKWKYDKMGCGLLFNYFTKKDNNMKKSKKSFQSMTTWFKQNGDPTKNKGWVKFKNQYLKNDKLMKFQNTTNLCNQFVYSNLKVE